MKYRAKLTVTFLIILVLSNVVTFAVVYLLASRALFREIGNNALSIAATTAAFVDGDEVKGIQNPGDEKTDAYRRIEEKLTKARAGNYRPDTRVENLYTMKPKVGAPNTLAYGVDSEESAVNKSQVDQALKIMKGRIPVLYQSGVDSDDFSTDQYGQWLSANAPVKDSAGNVVAAVGVDFPAEFVQAKLDRLMLLSFLGFAIVVAVAAGLAIYVSSRFSKPLRSLHQTVEAVGQGNFDLPVADGRADEFGLVGNGVNSMIERLRQLENVKSAFVSYVSGPALEKVLKGELPTVQADRRRITVLFSDIRQFTLLSEHMKPEDVVKILNEYFEKMVNVVVRRKGMVDKFIGDGLMALFGAPEYDAFQEENAVYAAFEMQEELRELCKKWSAEGRPPLEIGIGINSGNAVVGDLGSVQRLEYTAVGDTVNLASRLEALTKEFKTDVLISESTYEGLKGLPFSITKKGPTPVRGREASVMVYAVAPKLDSETGEQPVPAA